MLGWLDRMTALGAALLRAIAIGLGLEADWFDRHVTADPTVLFRIFRYPPGVDDGWGVGEHTDYGLLTILATDAQRRAAGARAGRVDRRAAGSRACSSSTSATCSTG